MTESGASPAGRRRAVVVAAAAAAALGLLAFFAYGGGFPNTDASWTLVWGRELLHLDAPTFAPGPTPHPLTNALGVLAAALHPASETILLGVGFVAVGALLVATFALTRALFGVAAAVVAVVLLATRDTLLFYGALAYVDVIFAALVVTAIALEAARPRRGAAVLLVLAVAGLARPEAWLLAAAYWVYARPRDRRQAVAWAALVVAAPLLWALLDLVVTGDPLYSFTSTRDATAETGRPTGVAGVLTEGPRIIARTARPDVCVVAIAGLVVAYRMGRASLLAGALVATALATAIPVAAGTPLNDRYVMVTMSLLCVAAAAPVVLLQGRREIAARAVGLACVVVLVAGTAVQAPRLADRRAEVVDRDSRRTAARDALGTDLPCTPLVVPNNRLVPVAASWLDVPVAEVRDGRDGVPRGSYLWGTEAAMRNLLVIEGRSGDAAPAPDAPVVRRSGGWTLMARC